MTILMPRHGLAIFVPNVLHQRKKEFAFFKVISPGPRCFAGPGAVNQ
jgi:hypothetical protein